MKKCFINVIKRKASCKPMQMSGNDGNNSLRVIHINFLNYIKVKLRYKLLTWTHASLMLPKIYET